MKYISVNAGKEEVLGTHELPTQLPIAMIAGVSTCPIHPVQTLPLVILFIGPFPREYTMMSLPTSAEEKTVALVARNLFEPAEIMPAASLTSYLTPKALTSVPSRVAGYSEACASAAVE